MSTTEQLYTKQLFHRILASLPAYSEEATKNLLILKANEPNTLQLLKLCIRAYFNNILNSVFISLHANDLMKALWLLQNIDCAKKIFTQYNYLDYNPYSDGEIVSYLPPFINTQIHEQDVIYRWNTILERLPSLQGSIGTLRKVHKQMRNELFARFTNIAKEERNFEQTFRSLAVNLLYEVGEYNNNITRFIDMFLPSEGENIFNNLQKDKERSCALNNSISSKAIVRFMDNNGQDSHQRFNEKSICLLARSVDGSSVLTLLN